MLVFLYSVVATYMLVWVMNLYLFNKILQVQAYSDEHIISFIFCSLLIVCLPFSNTLPCIN